MRLSARPRPPPAHLREVHAHLEVGDADFDEMLAHFRAAMAEKGFAPEDREAVMRRLGALRRVIVSR